LHSLGKSKPHRNYRPRFEPKTSEALKYSNSLCLVIGSSLSKII
jgi:hypothetical protein